MIHFNKNELTLNKDNYFQIPIDRIDVANLSQQIPNVFPPPYYPSQIIDKDFETKGNWMNKYGKDGYILFAYQSSKNNLIKLPKWITGITDYGATNHLMNFVDTTSDERALQNPNDPNKRALGAMYLSSNGGGPESFALNVTMNESMISSYYMSIYLCDWDYRNRKQSIHIMDAITLSNIAPIVYDEDFVNGLWITFKLDRSIRTRIYLVRGPTNVLSGIFFDANPP
eukprot:UN04543